MYSVCMCEGGVESGVDNGVQCDVHSVYVKNHCVWNKV